MLIVIRQISESNPLLVILFHFGIVDIIERSIHRILNRLIDKHLGVELHRCSSLIVAIGLDNALYRAFA